ncbi:uncharacterized protein LOC122038622 [Zingiber officinale]|uniref:uncharacterized protein LOC122038622 n=1 Tax=Zingiber officinale TaxID=94328 RepID=UPI001C4BE471|nr:uncharacterized protein LOC122038622 [Zingiber officinale]
MDGSSRFRPPQGHLCPICSTPHFPFCQMPIQMPLAPHAFDHYRPEFRRFPPGPAPPFSHRPPLWDHRPPLQPPRLHPPETWGVNRAMEGEIFRPFMDPPQRFPQDEFLGGETSYKRMRVEEPTAGTPHLHPLFDRNGFVSGRISVEDARRLNLIRDHGKLNEELMQSKGEFLPDRFARAGSQSQPGDARVDRVSDGSKFNSVGKSGLLLPLETISFSPNKVSRPSQFEGHQSFKEPSTSYGVERYAFRERLDFERMEVYDTHLGENRIGRCEKRYSSGGSDVQDYANARHNQYDSFPNVIHDRHDVSFQQSGSYRDDVSMPNTRYNAAHVTNELPFSVKRQQATHNTLNYLPRDQFEQNDRNDFPEIHAPKDYPYALPNAKNPEQVSYQLAREKSSYPAFGGPTESRFDLVIQQTDALGFPYEIKVPDICDTQRPLKPLNYPLSEESGSENFVVQGGFSNFSTIDGNGMSKNMGRMHTPGVQLSMPPSLPATHVPETSPLTAPPLALFPVLPITSIPTNRKYPDPHALPESSDYIQQPPPVKIAQDLPLIHQVPLKHFPDGVPIVSINHSINAKPTIVNACDLFKQPLRASRPDHIVIILRGLPGSGKSYLAKALRDIEIENGGNGPRIHAMDDYFMVEVEKNIDDNDGSKSTGSSRAKKQTTKKVIEYCYEPEMEEAYRSSMLKAFKKTLEEGIFTFIIVDDRNLRVADFAQFWAIAKRSGYEVYLLEAPYKDPMGCAARNVHGFTLEDTRKMAEKWEESPSLYMQIDIQSLFHGDDLNEQSIQEVDMDINDSDCDNNKAKLLEESLKYPEPKRDNFVHRQEKWEFDEGEEWQTRIKELGSSKWSKDLDEEDKKLEGVGKNINALSGLIHAYSKSGKSVHWGDQLNKSGFSIGTVKKHSLIIGPGSGYNLASNPVGENQDITEAAKTSNTSESKRRFSEKLRAEHESIRALLSKRRQRIGRLLDTDDD